MYAMLKSLREIIGLVVLLISLFFASLLPRMKCLLQDTYYLLLLPSLELQRTVLMWYIYVFVVFFNNRFKFVYLYFDRCLT